MGKQKLPTKEELQDVSNALHAVLGHADEMIDGEVAINKETVASLIGLWTTAQTEAGRAIQTIKSQINS